jgi:hypothetical protein
MEDKKFNNNRDWFFISEKLDALMNSLPVPPHTRKEFNDYDLYLFWTKLFTPGGGGGASQLFANALFVDAQFGNDATAVPFSLMDFTTNPLVNKYQTILAAKAAANFGDVIIVYPGQYQENANLYKNGVSYYFYPQANVLNLSNQPCWSTFRGQFCNVYGSGNFSNGSVGGVIFLDQGSLYMECHDIESNTNPVSIFDGDLQLKCHDILCQLNAAMRIRDSANTDNSVVINAYSIRTFTVGGNNPTISNVTSGPGYQGYLKITAHKISGSTNSGNPILRLDNFLVPGQTYMEFDVDFFEVINNADDNSIIDVFACNNTKYVIRGNIDTTNTPARRPITMGGPNSGMEFIYEGDIHAIRGRVLTVTGDGQVVRMRGKFYSEADSTFEISGTNSITYVDGEIVNVGAIP